MQLRGIIRLFGLLAILVGTSMCAGSFGADQADLTRRAAFDLNCPESRIQTVDLGGGTQGVNGCGKRATYVEKCDGQKGYATTTCGWVLNNSSE